MIFEGYSCNQIISQLHDTLMDRGDISDLNKAIIFEKIALIDNDLMEGSDEYLQLLDLLVVLMKNMKK